MFNSEDHLEGSEGTGERLLCEQVWCFRKYAVARKGLWVIAVSQR